MVNIMKNLLCAGVLALSVAGTAFAEVKPFEDLAKRHELHAPKPGGIPPKAGAAATSAPLGGCVLRPGEAAAGKTAPQPSSRQVDPTPSEKAKEAAKRTNCQSN